jgi:basic amino acid/polyamine antiporter, APA family
MLLLVPGETDFLGNLYSFGAMLSFTTAHVAIVALRFKDPERHRPYRTPWRLQIRGRELPLAPIVVATGTFTAWASVLVLHTEARTVGIAWMVAGMAGYFVYRRRQGLDPRQVYRLQRKAAPEGFTELAYRSALVPIFAPTSAHARCGRRPGSPVRRQRSTPSM